MSEFKENVNALLHEAMESERKAMEFYQNASSKAKSHAGKQFFNELAEFEHNHYEKVQHIIGLHKEGLSIEITSKEQPIPSIGPEVKGEIEFLLSDTGKGIPEEIKDKLFDSFVTSGKKGGTGLGLAIAKKVVEEHKGRIEVESELGKGTTFKIYIPKL